MVQIEWTNEQKIDGLMRLPWSLSVEKDDDGLVARVAEIPDAIATGANEKALALDLWESLRASLSVRVEHGDPIPLPVGSVLPWLSGGAQRRPRLERFVKHLAVGELELTTTSNAAAA